MTIRTADEPITGSLAKALAAAQGELKDPPLDKVNPHFKSKYASLAGILQTLRPTLSKHGLAILQEVVSDGDGTNLRTTLMHTSGEERQSSFALATKDATMQSLGSSITYARRYALMALAGVAGDVDDDDGEQAAPRPAQKALPQKPHSGNVPKFDSVEEAIVAIKSAGSSAMLNDKLAPRLAASFPRGTTDYDTAKLAYKDKMDELAELESKVNM